MQMQVLLSEENKLKESTNKELTRLTILADQVKNMLYMIMIYVEPNMYVIWNIFSISIHKLMQYIKSCVF